MSAELSMIEPLPMSLQEAWALVGLIEVVQASKPELIGKDDRGPLRWAHERLMVHIDTLVRKRAEALRKGELKCPDSK